jgi:two-component system cell cycle sensor histidine kinase/response regulator CckA
MRTALCGRMTRESEIITAHLETILLVDDEDAVRRLFAISLRRAGYAVHEASNGREALDVFDRLAGAIHLVVTDLRMPVMGGVELTRCLRARRQALKVICISGYAGELELDPSVDFLAKPISRHELLRKVQEVLARGANQA